MDYDTISVLLGIGLLTLVLTVIIKDRNKSNSVNNFVDNIIKEIRKQWNINNASTGKEKDKITYSIWTDIYTNIIGKDKTNIAIDIYHMRVSNMISNSNLKMRILNEMIRFSVTGKHEIYMVDPKNIPDCDKRPYWDCNFKELVDIFKQNKNDHKVLLDIKFEIDNYRQGNLVPGLQKRVNNALEKINKDHQSINLHKPDDNLISSHYSICNINSDNIDVLYENAKKTIYNLWIQEGAKTIDDKDSVSIEILTEFALQCDTIDKCKLASSVFIKLIPDVIRNKTLAQMFSDKFYGRLAEKGLMDVNEAKYNFKIIVDKINNR